MAQDHPLAELVIVGDGPARDMLTTQAAVLGITDRVRMLGALRHERVRAMLEEAAVVAVPSRFEGMPLVALEAAMAARPIVATPVQGLADIVQHRETGLIVPPEDPAALAGAISEVLDDADLAGRLGAAARRHAIANHSLETTASTYERLYHRLVADRSIRSGEAPS